jgi:uncharacterized protein with GYD domain
MALFVTKFKLVNPEIKNNKEFPDRIKEANSALEAAGGKLLGFMATLGDYDYIAIADVPGDEAAQVIQSGLNKLGEVRSTTLKTFTAEQFAQFIK